MMTTFGAAASQTVGTSPVAPMPQVPMDDVPELPHWFLGIVAGIMTFLFTLSILLYLANFPPSFKWMQKFRLKLRNGERRNGYSQLPNPSEDENTSATTSSASLRPAAPKQRKARSEELRVDTTVRYTGLGIALPDRDADIELSELATQERRSFDEEALRPREDRPLTSAGTVWTACTAPLPSIRCFGSTGEDAGVARSDDEWTQGKLVGRDLETGCFSPSTFERHRPATTSPYRSKGSGRSPVPSAGFLAEISDGVEWAAGRLARAMNDQVKDGPDEGLLLPVRTSEREKVVSPGLFAD